MEEVRTHLSVSVIVPAFNEAKRIGRSLDRIVAYLETRAAPYEVLVADDGSSDETAAAVEAHPSPRVRLERLPENRGKGAAVRTGVLASGHDLVLICDADLSTPIEDLERLVEWVEEYPVVIGSRQAAGARVARTGGRRLASRVFNAALWSMGLCPGLRDTQCGFKLVQGDAARELFADMCLDGFAFDIELLELARHRGLAIREVGVRWADSGASSVSMARHAPRMLRDALKVRSRLRRSAR